MSDRAREASYAWCRQVARTQAKNFYYSFLLLDKPRRDAMCAIYAFNRLADDLSDDPGPKTAGAFHQFRRDLDSALHGNAPNHPLWLAFADTATRYNIPSAYFHHMIDGVQGDITFHHLETFDDLYAYCYKVASVVGLTIIHVLGFEDPAAPALAEKCGVAFQLTNILRDVREDFDRNRIYLPQEDLRRHNVPTNDLGKDDVSPNLRRVLALEAERARGYYRDAMPLIAMVHKDGRPMLKALITTYARLLDRLHARDYQVLRERIRLSTPEKLLILAKAALI
jgi:15-cis-phytoene synthase